MVTYTWLLSVCIFLQAPFPHPGGWGDFKAECADFLHSKLQLESLVACCKKALSSAPVAWIHTDCKEHPIHFTTSYNKRIWTWRGKRLGEEWELPSSIWRKQPDLVEGVSAHGSGVRTRSSLRSLPSQTMLSCCDLPCQCVGCTGHSERPDF